MNSPLNSADALKSVLERQKKTFLDSYEVSLEERKQRIQQVINLLVNNQDKLVDAMTADFGGRHPGFSIMNDILGSLASLKYTRDHLEHWLTPEKREAFSPYDQLGAKAHVMYQPKGSIGIIGTWNAPLFTLLSPLACVLAAGNRAILKPSELTPNTAQAFAEAVSESLDPDVVSVVTGGADIGAAMSSMPFDHLVFTGSTAVGSKIMAAAAKNLVPVTLELGGKSPAFLSRSADLEESCRRIAIAKGTNGGQLCVSPDILYVPEEQLEDAIGFIQSAFQSCYPSIKENTDVVSVVNERHFNRIKRYVDQAIETGTRVEMSHDRSEISDSERRLPLAMAINPANDTLIMQEEIFGPALVIKTYSQTMDVIADINSRSKPLALYYFGSDLSEQAQVLNNTSSGGVSINDCLSHAAMHDAPFGGIGASGMGYYHGREGFLQFSHIRTVFEAPNYDPRAEWGMLPPYHPGFTDVMKQQVTPD